jgi:hypothetical protein
MDREKANKKEKEIIIANISKITRINKINAILDNEQYVEVMLVCGTYLSSFLSEIFQIEKSPYEQILISRRHTVNMGLVKLSNTLFVRIFIDVSMGYNMTYLVDYAVVEDMKYSFTSGIDISWL